MIKLNVLLLSLIALIIDLCDCVNKVKLGVYIESLCPDSKEFINDQLTPTFRNISQLFDIEFVPFGNSKYDYNSTTKEVTFVCQHGPEECYGNKIQSCLIVKSENNTELVVDFIDCMFRNKHWKKPEISGKYCANQTSIDWNSVNDCAIGALGSYIEMEMANKTNSLSPPQNWIPWITIDGKHDDYIQTEAENDLKKLICDAYAGVKPVECRQTVSRTNKINYDIYQFGRLINRNIMIEP